MENQEMDNGLELLKKVIKSNEDNIEKLIDVTFAYEDIQNLVGKFENSAKILNYQIENFGILFNKTNQLLEEKIHKIPKNIEANLSENTLLQLENFEKKSQSLKYVFWGSFGLLGVCVLVMILSFNFSKKWYSESIKTKEEIRKELLKEFENKGKGIYNVKSYEKLQYNMDLVNKWIEKYPNDADKFLRFKEGYETK
ncbi:hypothetical protein PG593_03945 [Riemerella anatipestifer]|uniref:hypothetical protein n=1 Tax=Riemerella anatipestifer TaxID=34085 RepID=UPI002A8A36D6|nr:hypothetical protein [Riemerella anatipestifer]MDY3357314.1 hypothetical protein [Riemerella anatipestifer]MDY3528931.1 hypothetical protein [Riemerella anatipestifer]MDY3537691.1 hypothetical protein [Riemerella anatipestifer]